MTIETAPVVEEIRDRTAAARAPRVTPGAWNDVADDWRRRKPERLWRRHADRVNGEWVARNLPDRVVGRLLKTDLFDEAATGGLYAYVRGRADVVAGVDLSCVTVRSARESARGLAAICADVRALPFPDRSFDVIVSNSTLDHFETEAEFMDSLRELRRILRPGGTLLLTLDNRRNPVVAARNALPPAWLRKLRILSFYVGFTCGPHGLRRRLAATGWDVDRTDAILHCPRFLSMTVAAFLNRFAGAALRDRYLEVLHGFESFARLPTRFLTGYFVAVRATPTREDRHVP